MDQKFISMNGTFLQLNDDYYKYNSNTEESTSAGEEYTLTIVQCFPHLEEMRENKDLRDKILKYESQYGYSTFFEYTLDLNFSKYVNVYKKSSVGWELTNISPDDITTGKSDMEIPTILVQYSVKIPDFPMIK